MPGHGAGWSGGLQHPAHSRTWPQQRRPPNRTPTNVNSTAATRLQVEQHQGAHALGHRHLAPLRAGRVPHPHPQLVHQRLRPAGRGMARRERRGGVQWPADTGAAERSLSAGGRGERKERVGCGGATSGGRTRRAAAGQGASGASSPTHPHARRRTSRRRTSTSRTRQSNRTRREANVPRTTAATHLCPAEPAGGARVPAVPGLVEQAGGGGPAVRLAHRVEAVGGLGGQ